MPDTRCRALQLLLSATLLFPLALPGQERSTTRPVDIAAASSRIDAIFAQFDNTRSPGCVVGIHQDGKLVFARGYGMADLERAVPLSPRSVLRIGSTSKQITSASIVLLEQDGLLSLDDPVQKHLPELQDFGPTLTLRHMMNMTSGLRDYLTLTTVAGYRDDDFYTDTDLLALLSRQRELNFEPNTAYLYSNSGYFLLSQIVLRVAGKSLREFAEERIFEPLGMTRTHYHDDHTEIVPDRAMGYRRTGDGAFAISMTTLPMTGDGGVFTTVEEWALWNRNFDEPRVGGEGLLRSMLTRAVLNNGDTLDYAIGLRHGIHRGLPTVSHGGAFVGFRADHIRYPSEDIAVTCFCNLAQTNPSALAAEVAEVLMEDRMDAEQPGEREARSQPSTSTPVRRAPTSSEAARLEGEFYSPELDVRYRFERGAERDLVVRVGASSLPVESDDDGGFWARGLQIRPTQRTGQITEFLLDAGRVRNLRFERVDR